MKKYLLICLALSGGLLVTCSKGPLNGDDDPTAAGCPVVEEFVDMAIQIEEPTTWTADKVYLFRGVLVVVESELTIEPGTVMKFDNSSITVRQGEHGRIIANGTADKRIVFTSYADNTHCGNTQADSGDAQPEKGDWGGIYIDGGNDHSFTYSDFLYAGGRVGDGSTSSAVELTSNTGDTFTFDHCVFAHTFSDQRLDPGSAGIYATFMAPFVHHDKPNPEAVRFTNNVFYDNDKPIMINAYLPVDPSNKFHNPENPAEKNARNFIHLSGVNTQYGDVTWGHTEVPYVVVPFFHGAREYPHTVTIGPNVIVKFPGPNGGISGYDNTRIIDLHPTAILTSYHDDANGGDSNGNGAETSPTQGDWLGFVIRMPGQEKDIWITEGNILYSRF